MRRRMRKEKKEYDVDEDEDDVKAELLVLCDDNKDKINLETDHKNTTDPLLASI